MNRNTLTTTEAADVKPWHVCPTCPNAKCGLSVVVTTQSPGRLFCPACGNRFDGTEEQITMAEKADAAWQEYLKEQGV